MKKLFLLLLLLPAVSISQGLVGKWEDKDDSNLITEFRSDGTWDFTDAKNPFSWLPLNAIAKYSLTLEEGVHYLTFDFQYFEHSERTKCKYILEGDKLIIFKKRIDSENITTSGEVYKTVEIVYTRIKE